MIHMRVVIFTEAGGTSGHGHLARCVSLFQAFEDRNIAVDLVVEARGGSELPEHLLPADGWEEVSWRKPGSHAFRTLDGDTVVVIDSYLAREGVYRKAAARAGLLLSMDDCRRIDYPPGIVLNPAPQASYMAYPRRHGTTYLLGPRYFCARREFWSTPSRAASIREDIKSVLVLFGGTDPRGLADVISGQIALGFPSWQVHLVRGEERPGRIGYPNLRLHRQVAARDLIRLMEIADVAVSAAGQSLHELAAMGVPTVAVVVADNQEVAADAWRRSGFITGFHRWNDESIEHNVIQELRSLRPRAPREERARIGRRLVDGDGSRRTADAVIQCMRRGA